METLQVSLRKIKVQPDRGRKKFTRIEELAESIKTKGWIHPICVTDDPENPGSYILIAGERRYRAAVFAGFKEVPVTFRDSLTPLEQKILELEENMCRQDIDWSEQAETMRQIHELKQQENSNWKQEDTAALYQQTQGSVSLQISVAEALKKNPELKAKVQGKPIRHAHKIIQRQEDLARVKRLKESGQLQVTLDLLHGDCRELIKKLPDDSIDLLMTDPPYGIDKIEDLRKGGSVKMPGHQSMSEHHNLTLDQVLELMRELAPELNRVLKPGCHFYIFCAMQYCQSVIEAILPLEFQPPLVIWDRGKPTTPAYGYNYMNRIEAVVYGHKPPRGKRLAKNKYNILEHKEVPKSLRLYPTEKPQSLLIEMIKQSTVPGDTVLDPFAGSASTLKAAKHSGRRSIGFEIDEVAWHMAQESLQDNGDSDE